MFVHYHQVISGNRENSIYGNLTLEEIEKKSIAKCKELNIDLFFLPLFSCCQNTEGQCTVIFHFYSPNLYWSQGMKKLSHKCGSFH